jgi:hypothetical protein
MPALQRAVGNRAVGRLLAGATRAATPAAPARATGAPEDTSVARLLRDVAQARRDTPAGGETIGEGEDAEYLGGDGGVARAPDAGAPAGAGSAAPPAPAAPAAPATLTYSTVTPRTAAGCGGYTYAVRWGLAGADATTNGFIVQQLTFDLRRQSCAGGDNNFSKKYWEAWQVRGGQIFVGTSTSPHSADTFRVPATPDHRGVNFEEGKAKFIPGYTAPLSWGTVPEAGSLPATETEPAGWSNSGALVRSVRVSFDCCERSDLGTITGDG